MHVSLVFRKGPRVSWIRRSAGRRIYGAVWKVLELSVVSRTEPVHVNTMKVMMSVKMGLQ